MVMALVTRRVRGMREILAMPLDSLSHELSTHSIHELCHNKNMNPLTH
jgi:hypothetical protein